MSNIHCAAQFRRPTGFENERIVRFLELEYRYYRIPAILLSCFFGIVGSMSVLSVLTDRNLFEKLVSLLVGAAMCAGCGAIVKVISTKKKQLRSIREGRFDVLDCRIVEITHHDGGTGAVKVCDESGSFQRERLRIDGKTIGRFQNGENPRVLLMRHSDDQYVLFTEYSLGGRIHERNQR